MSESQGSREGGVDRSHASGNRDHQLRSPPVTGHFCGQVLRTAIHASGDLSWAVPVAVPLREAERIRA